MDNTSQNHTIFLVPCWALREEKNKDSDIWLSPYFHNPPRLEGQTLLISLYIMSSFYPRAVRPLTQHTETEQESSEHFQRNRMIWVLQTRSLIDHSYFIKLLSLVYWAHRFNKCEAPIISRCTIDENTSEKILIFHFHCKYFCHHYS